MTLPARLVQSVRPQASSGVVAGAAVVASVFAATPFVLPDVSSRLSVPLGATGILSTAQVASFALASFLAGRLLRPRRRLHYGGLLLIVLANVVAALVPEFWTLVATRVVGGVGMGTLTWIAWADATRFKSGIGEVAIIAPITAALVSPLYGALIGEFGYQAVFGAAALVAAVSLVFKVDFADLPRIGRKVSKSKSNRVLLIALALLTMGGSSVFIFSAAVGTELVGLSAVAVSVGLSLNALTGALGTRYTSAPGRATIWLVAVAASAALIGSTTVPGLFFGALALWGFAYWVVVPACFRLLADRSLVPSERIGDAQAVMAAGRIAGPLVGGLAIAGDNFGRLSLTGASILVVAAVLVLGVEQSRRTTNEQ